MITLYDDKCTPCVRKSLWKQLKTKAAEKRVLITRIDVSKSKEERERAMSYNMALPFIVENGKALTVAEFLHD